MQIRICKAALLLNMLALVLSQSQVRSAPAYSQAISDFQSRKYSKALAGFQSASRAAPSDPICHYYMALCYQGMNQVSLACQEYQWVAAYSRDPRLKAQAQSGLAQLSRYQTQRAQQSSAAAASKQTIATSQPSGSRPSVSKSSAGGSFARGKLKIIEFSTKWCGPCKAFAPIFHKVESSGRYSNCEFQSLDAEEPANSDLVQKYAIRGYPTTVFADSSGTQVDRLEGGTTEEGLIGKIDGALQRLSR